MLKKNNNNLDINIYKFSYQFNPNYYLILIFKLLMKERGKNIDFGGAHPRSTLVNKIFNRTICACFKFSKS